MKALRKRRLDRLKATRADLAMAVENFKKAYKLMDPLSGDARRHLRDIQDLERILKRTDKEIAKLEAKLGRRGQVLKLDNHRKSRVG